MSDDTAVLGENIVAPKVPRYTTIILEDSDDIPPTGLFVGHNGRSFMIQSGREVDVPDEILEVLDHAVGRVAVLEQGTKKLIDSRTKLRFPYRVVRRSKRHISEPDED